jgi:sterol desaturase/sphingolipid hydroxylase (fatty acid hydroxylase superfamily)
MRNADRVTAALLLGSALAFSAGALKYYDYWGEGGPGPGFLPFWLGLVMALLASTMLVQSLKSKEPGEAWLPHGKARKRVVAVIGITILFVALLKVLGMVIGSALYLAVLMRYLERKPWPLTAAVSLCAAGVNYLVFAYWLHVPFPEGMLWPEGLLGF